MYRDWLVDILPEVCASSVRVIVTDFNPVLLPSVDAHVISIHVYSPDMAGAPVVGAMGSWVMVLW